MCYGIRTRGRARLVAQSDHRLSPSFSVAILKTFLCSCVLFPSCRRRLHRDYMRIVGQLQGHIRSFLTFSLPSRRNLLIAKEIASMASTFRRGQHGRVASCYIVVAYRVNDLDIQTRPTQRPQQPASVPQQVSMTSTFRRGQHDASLDPLQLCH